MSYNDEHDAELRLLGREPADLAIRADAGSLRITRLYDALPTATHRIYITLYVQNLTPSAGTTRPACASPCRTEGNGDSPLAALG